MKKLLLLILFCMTLQFSKAQHETTKRNCERKHDKRSVRGRFATSDFGFMIGMAYYLGDLNPRKHFFLAQPAAGGFFRYNPNYRTAVKVFANYGSIMGDDSQSNDADQLQRNLNFKSDIYEFGFSGEFNFWEYQIGSDHFKFSPYMFLGAAIMKFNPVAQYNGNDYELRNLHTEGQTYKDGPAKQYKLVQMSIPFGLGIKMNVATRVGIGLEWGMRKTFTDYLDDVSGKYYDKTVIGMEKGPKALVLSDRSKTSTADPNFSNTGRMRGNPRTKDWYNFTGLTIFFKIIKPNKPCYSYH